MSGAGRRFLDAGYIAPKPLIPVDGKPMIEHVVNMYPGEKKITFICSRAHLNSTNLRQVLGRIAPKGRILAIEPHKKGPVYAVSKAVDLIEEDEEVIVSYCDFSKYYDYHEFLLHTRNRDADGAITCYKGFHPHMLYPTNYAFVRHEKQWLLEIREKQSFTDNRMEEYASDGTYYFKKGAYVKKYFQKLMDRKIGFNGEYYVSMVYNLMLEDNLKISIYDIVNMLQWGTPRDMEEYQGWSDFFKDAIKPRKNILPLAKSINLIPMAGKGMRFSKEGYVVPKPLVRVSGKSMVVQAARSLPSAERHIFICLEEHFGKYALGREIKKYFPRAKIIRIKKITGGQACTCEIGLKNEDMDAPLLIAPADSMVGWDNDKYKKLINSRGVDCVAWSFKRHHMAELKPQMYGWIKTDGNDNAAGVSVKAPVSSDPYNDHGISGIFWFKKTRIFFDGLMDLYRNNVRVNGEFYVDSVIDRLIKSGYKVKVFPAERYISWGTPDELKTFEYWQMFFHRYGRHPYRLEKDVMVCGDPE